MKISELNTKSFLGASGAAENSYVLINYEDETTNEPVTYKATVQELGKAIANKLQLTTNGQNGLATVKSSNGAWASEDKGQLVTAAEKTKIANAASTGAITAAVNNLVNFNYLYATTNGAGYGNVMYDPETSTLRYMYNAASNFDIPFASIGDMTTAVNGLASTGYVNAHAGVSMGEVVANASLSGTPGTLGDYLYNNFISADSSDVTSMNDVVNAVENPDSILYEDIVNIISNANLASTGYVTSAIANKASTGAVTAAVSGLASTGYVTDAISGLASTGYVDEEIMLDAFTLDNFLHQISAGITTVDENNDTTLVCPVLYDVNNETLCLADSTGLNVNALNPNKLAYLDTSSNKPCIRDYEGTFKGFLSTT